MYPDDLASAFCCWPECGNRLPDHREMPVCTAHFIKIGAAFMVETRARLDLPAPMPVDPAKQQHALQAQSQVYYIRIGDHIKIGYTVNLRARCSALRVDTDAVSATEPGGIELERKRHLEFADERVGRRENFNPSPRLMAHIEAIKAEHGGPTITTYPKVA